ncbi:adenosylcobinamide kinase/adenosylcobinamide phosphate guanyltransferase [Massilia sp. Root418]|jgi:adenosylcobinamide kinase/adenosylcobinamide-phosphate guanylyltransferase|uniref:bifunctional adenosylcobinamide kinase/adenosylcobinamide-phosphate guanylyltransferase n=1 Tax=Massilia sp. Root418 TaxID=1736532 RepID=UPI0006F81A1D|nr:bifunctional adenosylcobinamide kinase/adenosylcobinamide-phosphate guanylyltransferase [Massilia sp. Root418]KQW99173.1 adenosylcobinamide kinase/adenosylcobinamide phosphate guanyltransferase [Massilia sp. Root418]
MMGATGCTLVFGGARSGKSAYAEQLAIASGKEVVYIATARAGDGEMAVRIAHHQRQRPAAWTTVEEPLALAGALRQWRAPGRLVLVDCLTLWLSNLMFADGTDYPDVGEIALPERFHAERAALLDVLAGAGGAAGGSAGEIVLVSNEVGMGIVPYGAISRAFTDEAGRLNQAVAAVCSRAVFVAAGLPLVLKGAPC